MSAKNLSFIIAELIRIDQLTKGQLRFGQIIGNAIPGDPYYVKDDVMERTLREYRGRLEAER